MPTPGWRHSTGHTRTSTTAWKRTRARILTRDHHTCTHCGAPATDVDHVLPVSQGGTDHDTNLTSLCTTCHARKTSAEGYAARIAKGMTQHRPAPQHPGII